MANLGLTPLQVTSGVTSCGLCGAHLGGRAAGLVVRCRYTGPELAAVEVAEGAEEGATVVHKCPGPALDPDTAQEQF